MVIAGTVVPLLSTVALGLFARDSGSYALGYVLTGNLVLALMFGTLDKVASNFAFMRARGMLDYFAALPIRSAALVLATVLAFFLLSIPSVLVTLLFGAWYLGIEITYRPLLLVVLPLAAFSLAGIGAWIGVTVRTPEEAGSLSTLLTLCLLGIGPVLVPSERLPNFLVTLGWFSPATYAASALRQVLLGEPGWRLLLDMAILVLLTVVVLWGVGARMEWQRSQS